jgi:hypothetical protein
MSPNGMTDDVRAVESEYIMTLTEFMHEIYGDNVSVPISGIDIPGKIDGKPIITLQSWSPERGPYTEVTVHIVLQNGLNITNKLHANIFLSEATAN